MNNKQTSPRVASVAAWFLGQSENSFIKMMAASALVQAKKEPPKKIKLIVKK